MKTNEMTLVLTEQYDTTPCEFYKRDDYDLWLTREQIGTALGYADPLKAIQKIHDRHRDRLDKFCIRAVLPTVEAAQIVDFHEIPQIGKTVQEARDAARQMLDYFELPIEELQQKYAMDNSRPQDKNLRSEVVYYSERGIMEICRWSRQPNADKFMDWCFDIIEKYRHHELLTVDDAQKLIAQMNEMKETITSMQNEIATFKRQTEENQLVLEARMDSYDSGRVEFDREQAEFVHDMSKKLRELAPRYGYEDGKYAAMMSDVIRKMEDECGISFSYYCDDYKQRKGIDQVGNRLEVIAAYDDLQENFMSTYRMMAKRVGITDELDEFLDSFLDGF